MANSSHWVSITVSCPYRIWVTSLRLVWLSSGWKQRLGGWGWVAVGGSHPDLWSWCWPKPLIGNTCSLKRSDKKVEQTRCCPRCCQRESLQSLKTTVMLMNCGRNCKWRWETLRVSVLIQYLVNTGPLLLPYQWLLFRVASSNCNVSMTLNGFCNVYFCSILFQHS